MDWNRLFDTKLQQGQTLVVGWVLYDATQSPGSESSAPPKSKIQVQSEPPPAIISRPAQPLQNTASQPVQPNAVTTPDANTQAAADTIKKPASDAEQEYMTQTNDGSNVITEKGPAVFFEKARRGNTYYAFHNTAPRGTIIKVHNPGNGREVFVKVIGKVPETKLYAGTIIGISSSAEQDLGVSDGKMWCELTYVPN